MAKLSFIGKEYDVDLNPFNNKKADRSVAIAEDVRDINTEALTTMVEDVKFWIDSRTTAGLSESEQAVKDMLEKTDEITSEGLQQISDIYALNKGSIATNTGKSVEAIQKGIDELAPYLGMGEKAATQWEKAMGLTGGMDAQDFLSTLPGYQGRFKEGQRAVMASASARGGMGGRALKELTEFGQDLAGEYWGDYIGSLEKGVGTGLQAATTAGQLYGGMGNVYAQESNLLANLTMGQASNVSNLTGISAGARVSGYGGLLQNIGSLYGTGMGAGTGAIQTGATGIAQSNLQAAEAAVAAINQPSFLERLAGNIQFTAPINVGGGGGTTP